MTLKIDSHQQFWQFGGDYFSWLEAEPLAPLRRDFLPADLQPAIHEVNVKRTVVVAARRSIAENRWLLGLADKHDFIAGVVGCVNLASPECEDQLLEAKQHPKFVGVRHAARDEPNDNYLVRDDVRSGLETLQKHAMPLDLLCSASHLHHVRTLAEQYPALPLAIDHLAQPHIKEGLIDDWLEQIAATAEYPNVYCKLSGLSTAADLQDWRPEDLRPYVEKALELFSPERCMFGSDWPTCLLAGTYRQTFDALDFCLAGLTSGERHRILAETALEFYGLNVGNH